MMKQEDTKQKILDKALDLFSTQGYDSVSVGEIAKAVGIKAPSLYNHFPSKQAIFDTIVESTAAQYEADTDKIDIHVQNAKQDIPVLRRSPPTRSSKRCGRYSNILSIMKRSAGFAA